MKPDKSFSLEQIPPLLAMAEYADHPLRDVLAQLWQEHQSLVQRVERISRISDGFQHMAREKELSLGEQLDKQLRQLEKIARISDRYQHMMRDLNLALKEASTRDELTGLPNRRFLIERLKQESDRCLRYQRPLTLVMLDLDRFKQINDGYGHDIGDRALVETARAMQAELRDLDICGRWGGEEFLFVLPETTVPEAAHVVGRILAAIRRMKLRVGENVLSISASAGIAAISNGENYSDTITRADGALLQAKRNGRDGYVLAP